jgi:Ca-activated chloride channel homolog
MLKVGALTFLWPSMLWLLAAVPLLLLIYWRMLRRRSKLAARFARLQTTGGLAGKPGRFWRHLPGLLMLLGLTAMIFAVARPQAAIVLPSRVETVILAMDMSGSMRATDVAPDRITAAKAAAKSFIDDQPRQVRIGVVGVAGTAAVVQAPTKTRTDVLQAIDRLEPQRGTALGSGLIIALATLLPDADIDVQQFINGPNPRAQASEPMRKPGAGAEKREPSQPGANNSAAIVLLSDGQSNTGPDPMKAVEILADQGVRVFTVGIGTVEGTKVTAEGWSMRVKLDEETLKKIAAATDGEYFRAGNATDLKKIYQYLSAKLALEKRETTEITSLFVALGAVLAMIAALVSMSWYNRIL